MKKRVRGIGGLLFSGNLSEQPHRRLRLFSALREYRDCARREKGKWAARFRLWPMRKIDIGQSAVCMPRFLGIEFPAILRKILRLLQVGRARM